MDYEIQVSGIKFKYGYRQVLDEVSLNIEQGKFISILGPNGSGKSTLLKVISSVLKPSEGVVLIESMDLRNLTKKAVSERISVVPQNTSLEFDFKVFDVVLMGRYPHISKLKGESKKDIEIAKDAMRYTNVSHLSDRSFNELSGGERQRVILAQALTQQPKIILLDEPVSHLDLQHQIEILNLIKKMCIDNKLTVIAVLHDLNMAATYSDVVVMMKDGAVKYHGSPYEVLTESSIQDVFNINVHVSVSPAGNKPYIYADTRLNIRKLGRRGHIICGGGSGSEVIKSLHYAGYDISCGVLSIGDLDWKISKDCDAELAEEIPFMEISDTALQKNRELIEKADFIILTGLYFGCANIKNLEILLEDAACAKKIYVLEDESFSERDFTEGYAQKLYNELKCRDTIVLTDTKALYQELIKAGNTHV